MNSVSERSAAMSASSSFAFGNLLRPLRLTGVKSLCVRPRLLFLSVHVHKIASGNLDRPRSSSHRSSERNFSTIRSSIPATSQQTQREQLSTRSPAKVILEKSDDLEGEHRAPAISPLPPALAQHETDYFILPATPLCFFSSAPNSTRVERMCC